LDAAASVECYPDDRRSLGPLIEAEARAAGMTIAPEARDSLVALLGADRGVTRGELTKLTLYAQGKSRIELEDVEAIVADAAPSSLDATIDATLLGDMAGLEAGAQRFFADGGDVGHLVARLTQRVTLLHRLRLEMERGKAFEAALQGQPGRFSPVARAALGRQAERWTAASVGRRLPALAALAGRVRRTPRLAQAQALRALWALASGLRAGRG
jgi:DNA polymerase-3 subunit delta